MLNPFKTDLTALTGLSRDALHVHFGLLGFLLIILIFRKSPASLLPWACVMVLELANEALDIFHWHNGALSFSLLGTVKDVLNTMLWPTVILLLARFAPGIATWRR